jgi:Glutathione S-transferase N-terminal domain
MEDSNWWWATGSGKAARSSSASNAAAAGQFSTAVKLGNGSSPLTLIQFRPAWMIQAYLRFAGIPYRLENSKHASTSSSAYPQLQDGNFLLPSANILGHLVRYRRDLDANLTAQEVAEGSAFGTLLHVLGSLLQAVSLCSWKKATLDRITIPTALSQHRCTRRRTRHCAHHMQARHSVPHA